MSISKITNTGWVSNSYVRFTNANGINLVQLKTGKSKKGIYNIPHINSYHSKLKRFMRDFNDVSTKYLNNYPVWQQFHWLLNRDLCGGKQWSC